jgi:FKBP-type peptidyl-prolyl cis-trans isomerase FkpA
MDGCMKTKTMLYISRAVPAMIICLFLLGGCNKTVNDSNSFTFDKDTSYALGMYFATQFVPNAHYDYQSFMEGFRAYNEALETRFSLDEAIMKIQAAFELIAAMEESRYQAESSSNREEGLAFLNENSKRAGVTTLASGLQYEVLREGRGEKPAATDMVQVHYEGTLINGTVFDSSYERNVPAEFPLYAVIQGWTEGLQLMSVGSMYRFFIPSDLGYGSSPVGIIPGSSVLIFRVELLAILEDDYSDYWY